MKSKMKEIEEEKKTQRNAMMFRRTKLKTAQIILYILLLSTIPVMTNVA